MTFQYLHHLQITPFVLEKDFGVDLERDRRSGSAASVRPGDGGSCRQGSKPWTYLSLGIGRLLIVVRRNVMASTKLPS